MILINVNYLLEYIMENTICEVSLDGYWFKFDTNIGYKKEELLSMYGEETFDYLVDKKLIRQSKPYKLYYSSLITFLLYHYLYNNLISGDIKILYDNMLLMDLSMQPKSYINRNIIEFTSEELIEDMMIDMYLKFKDKQLANIFIDKVLKLANHIDNKFNTILEDRVLEIKINCSGTLEVLPGENIYKLRYDELVNAAKYR